MKAEIIAVGSELLLGQITNTNATYISKQLANIGIDIYYHTVVGDNDVRLKDAIEVAKGRSDLLIFTGGLGPTKDDVTKETVAQIVEQPLVYDPASLQAIEEFFTSRNKTMTENNKKQALVIKGSTVLANECGLAPGMAVVKDGIYYLLFPGPPKELQPMFENAGKPYLTSNLPDLVPLESRVLRFFGIGESRLETELMDIIEAQSNPTIAPLAGEGEVTLRLTVKHIEPDVRKQMLDEVEKKIVERVGEFLYGYDDTSLLEEVIDTLLKQNMTISTAESLTGGMFSEQLTNLPGASSFFKGAIVCYATKVKETLLGVSSETLQQFGAVSKETAIEMARQIKQLCDSNIGISFTGVAGPDPQEDKPVGTVFIAIATNTKEVVHELHITGSRQQIRERTIKNGCYYLVKELKKVE
ncbi:competence/damage-inducible protein A [Bacillus alkalicellulosilyticus]|uniref:competence/damage-inducible protein A n=1 Tax=Alkalihalobacterium alkalicellulosilyticum TaxID=1912214 RepID=UPI000997EBBE|nr:competence/damage-inducible protein A [Bacillus alkalicellulosilyticus]